MAHFSLPLTRIIHENLAVIMTFCYSHNSLAELMNSKFQGEWKYLNKCLFDLAPQRAIKACYELALFLRILDDEENMKALLEEMGTKPNLGTLVMKDATHRELTFRDAANKIIHSSSLEWNFKQEDCPILVCLTRNEEQWIRAEINIISLAAFCGQLLH